jgi:DNA replication protein DnaC
MCFAGVPFLADWPAIWLLILPGLAKSHIAQALGSEAARQGLDLLFVNTQKMLQHLNGGRADGSWERRLNTYLRPDLLILDDFGNKCFRHLALKTCMM